MPNRYLPILATTALLTAAASVGQPQTTTGTTDASTTNSPSSATTTPTPGSMSTPATNPSGTTTGTATDSSTGSKGMQGTFQGSSQETTGAAGTSATGTSTTDTTGGTSTGDTSATGSTTTGASGTMSDGATSTDRDAATGTAAGATASATAAAGSNALQGQDAQFLRRAMEADRMEITSAQAAIDNAQRAQTKTTAQMLVDDHTASSQKLQQLVSRKGWSLPAGISTAESDQARMTTAGAGFDERFMAEQIRMHRDAISLYREQVSSGSDPDLRQFAQDTLPHLEHHLEMLQGSNTQK